MSKWPLFGIRDFYFLRRRTFKDFVSHLRVALLDHKLLYVGGFVRTRGFYFLTAGEELDFDRAGRASGSLEEKRVLVKRKLVNFISGDSRHDFFHAECSFDLTLAL